MLTKISDTLVYGWLHLAKGERLTETVHFFIYDSLKIFLLLAGMIALIGFLRTYLPQEKLRGWLSQKKSSYAYAALFGAMTPFCSCSSIPIFMSFIRAGVPLGVAFTFLITSPLINEYLVVLMAGSFGIKIAAAYVMSGLVIGVTAGAILGSLKLEKYLMPDVAGGCGSTEKSFQGGFADRVMFGVDESLSVIQKLWMWILVGVGIGALIHNFIPQEVIQSVVGKAGVLSVPVAALLGVPLYGSCAAIVPVAVVLFEKGVPLGTALTFMMAVSALSLPEAIMLKRVMTMRLIVIFFSVTTAAIILTGYLFNFLHA